VERERGKKEDCGAGGRRRMERRARGRRRRRRRDIEIGKRRNTENTESTERGDIDRALLTETGTDAATTDVDPTTAALIDRADATHPALAVAALTGHADVTHLTLLALIALATTTPIDEAGPQIIERRVISHATSFPQLHNQY
jgi:hypothetical protein